jgi:hypothetical protein
LIANLTALANYTPAELVELVKWEMRWGIPLIHNGPLEGQSGIIPDDSGGAVWQIGGIRGKGVSLYTLC